jgi:hypothetical protein
MVELIFCCQSCGKLFIGSRPEVCECGSSNIRQGIESLGYEAKQELARIRRAERNQSTTNQYRLGGKR